MKHSATLASLLIASSLGAQNLDPTFGIAGKVLVDFGMDNDDAQDLIIQPDGRMLVSGYVSVSGTINAGVCRLLPDGTLDASFGTGGKATVLAEQTITIGQTLALQPDGKVLIGGHRQVGATYDLFVARLNANGTLDATFGTAGVAAHTTQATGSLFWDMALQADGKILITGQNRVSGNTAVITARLLITGALDPSFGTNGVATQDLAANNDAALGLAVQPDGRIVLAGYSVLPGRQEIVLIRMNTNGTLDASFGTAGVVNLNISNDEDFASDLMLQADGRIIVVGSARPSNDTDILAVRLLANGSPDPAFGAAGIVLFDEQNFQEVDRAVIDSEGALVMSTTVDGTFNDIRLLRLLANGTPDANYDATFNISDDDASSAIAIQADGKVVVVGEHNDGATTADMLVMRFNAPGMTGIHDPMNAPRQLAIFPDPVVGIFSVRSEEPFTTSGPITVRDRTGRAVNLPLSINGTLASIDGSALAPGCYTITARTSKGPISQHFIKD